MSSTIPNNHDHSNELQCVDVARVAGLKPKRKGEKELLYRCPRHDDERPSLQINPAKNCFICFPCRKSGSEAGGGAWQLVAFLNGWEFDENRKILDWLQEKKLFNRYEVEYVYENEFGKPVFKLIKYPNRSFSLWRHEDGKWISGIKQKNDKGVERRLVRLVPYRLPDFLNEDRVLLVEGEKDCDAAWDLGFPASCNPMGAGEWQQEYNSLFVRKSVTIIPDNDSAGRNHARNVAENLFRYAKEIRLLELPDLPDKGDISDWIDAGGTKEQLEELIEATEPLTQEDLEDWEEETEPPRVNWIIRDAAQAEEWDVPPLEPLIEGIAARGNLGIVAGPTQSAKSIFGLYLARKLILGGDLFDLYKIHPVSKVLYFCLEDPQRRARDRLLDIEDTVGALPKDRFKLYFPDHTQNGIFSLADADCFDEWEQLIEDEAADVIFVDTFQRSTPGVLSFDDEKQSVIWHRLSRLYQKTGATPFIIEHFRKTPGNGKQSHQTLSDAIKGSITKAVNADTGISMQRLDSSRPRKRVLVSPIYLIINE